MMKTQSFATLQTECVVIKRYNPVLTNANNGFIYQAYFFGVTPGYWRPKAPPNTTFGTYCNRIFLHATYASYHSINAVRGSIYV